jgi:hypothetical protein
MQKLLQDTRTAYLEDSPEMMRFDCHLCADLKEEASKNVSLTFHLRKKDEELALKYSFATRAKVPVTPVNNAQGCPSNKCISQDVKSVPITSANNCSGLPLQPISSPKMSNKILQNGVRRWGAQPTTNSS